MTRQTNALFIELDKEALTVITHSVKEVSDLAPAYSGKKNFSAADLWYIQRQKRVFVQRRVNL